jgi:hypothetical protein
MIRPRHALWIAAVVVLALSAGRPTDAQRNDDKKASLSLRATPPVGFSPLKVRLTVEVRGGPDDSADLYCPTVEWDWGDDLKSESAEDCEPYTAGSSTIRRRYSSEHTFMDSGSYTVRVRMKQGSRVVATGSTNVQVREGIRGDLDG